MIEVEHAKCGLVFFFEKKRGKNLSLVLKNMRIRVHARPSKEIDNFARVAHFLVHFFAVTARLPRQLTRLRLSPPWRPLRIVGITLTQADSSDKIDGN